MECRHPITDDAVYWRYSTVRNYAGQEGLLDVYQQW